MSDAALWLNGRWLSESPERSLAMWARAQRVPVPPELEGVRDGDVFLITLGRPRWWGGLAIIRGTEGLPAERLGLRRTGNYMSVRADVFVFPQEPRVRAPAYGVPALKVRAKGVKEEVALRVLDEVAPGFIALERDLGTLRLATELRVRREVRDVALEHFRAVPAFRSLWVSLTEPPGPESDEDRDALVLPASPSEASILQIEKFYRKVFLNPHWQLPMIQGVLERLEGGQGPIIIGEDGRGGFAMDVHEVIQAERESKSAGPLLAALAQLSDDYREG